MAIQQATLIPTEPSVPIGSQRTVAIHADIAVVGVPSRKTVTQTGAVYVYRRGDSGWVEEAEFLGWDDITPYDGFGLSVAITEDMLVVGAPYHGRGGAVFCYPRMGGTWIEQGYLEAPATYGNSFGAALAMDGNVLLVSRNGYYTDPGRVFAYRRDGLNWVPDGSMVGDPVEYYPTRDGEFGYSVAYSADTQLAVVGAPIYPDPPQGGLGSYVGAAYVFRRRGDGDWVRAAKLVPYYGQEIMHFGHSVSISGLRALVGAPYATASGVEVGAAYVFEPQDDDWVPIQTLRAGDPATEDWFGASVDLTSTTALVGAPGDDLAAPARSAYVFEPVSGSWAETAKISKPADPHRDTDNVALSDTAVIMSLPGLSSAAAASVYRKTGGTWSEEATLTPREGSRFDGFGTSVSIAGDWVAVGAPGDDPGDAEDAGAVYLYERTSDTWVQQMRLTAPTPQPATQAGFTVALSADTLLVGSPPQPNLGPATSGLVYVFRRADGTWSLEATLPPTDTTQQQQFGCAVAVSGDTAVVGARLANTARGDKTGAAYVFIRQGGQWTEQTCLIGSDVAANNFSGSAVAIDDNTVVVGNAGHGPSSGAVYVFVRSGSSWTEQAVLLKTNAVAQDRIGYSVAIVGDRVVAGAPGRRILPKTSGYACVFERTGSSWSEPAQLTPPSPQTPARFGTAVEVCDDGRVLVGDPASRKVYLFAAVDGSWQQKDVLDGILATSFGSSLCASRDTAVVGAPSADTPIGPSGAALVFSLA